MSFDNPLLWAVPQYWYIDWYWYIIDWFSLFRIWYRWLKRVDPWGTNDGCHHQRATRYGARESQAGVISSSPALSVEFWSRENWSLNVLCEKKKKIIKLVFINLHQCGLSDVGIVWRKMWLYWSGSINRNISVDIIRVHKVCELTLRPITFWSIPSEQEHNTVSLY